MAPAPLLSCARLACAVVVLSGVAQAESSANSATISANVGPLRSNKGVLACRLYASADGFPITATGAFSQRVRISGNSARCVFENVMPGTYAIVVHHDENDNHQFDKNLLGMPLEGYGASNNHTHALSAPTWQESKFVVARGEARALAISMRY
ncbi:MAG: DUF2141 domain-containing protein [Pseudomonadota bacterium]